MYVVKSERKKRADMFDKITARVKKIVFMA